MPHPGHTWTVTRGDHTGHSRTLITRTTGHDHVKCDCGTVEQRPRPTS